MSVDDNSVPSGFFSGEPKKLPVRYTWLCCVLLYCYLALAIFVAVVVHYVNPDLDFSPLLNWYWLVFPIMLLLTIYTLLASRAKAYVFGDNHLDYFSGVVFRSVTVQPFSRLQHMEITRGPLQRVFGLATLKLFSAGGAQQAVAVPGLPLNEAEQLRGSILYSKGLTHEQ